jgi:glutamate N-acetyltransferase/amino-acid N-acetyltransferase
VLVASTGPIGKFLPMEKVEEGIGRAASLLRRAGGRDAAEAILTTDTVVKRIAVTETIGGTAVRIGAMAKGAGMIEPNMATMLAFITTDAAVDRQVLSECLSGAVETSFNRITVDGDRSTNDMVIALANGLAQNRTIRRGAARKLFQEALDFLCLELAKMIVRDGEGATKFIEVTVRGARAIANSNLVKTALHGGSPNWGRIMAALGYSGAAVKPRLVDIFLCGVRVAGRGEPVDYDKKKLSTALRRKEIQVVADLKLGAFERTVWTCDLSEEYVGVNL